MIMVAFFHMSSETWAKSKQLSFGIHCFTPSKLLPTGIFFFQGQSHLEMSWIMATAWVHQLVYVPFAIKLWGKFIVFFPFLKVQGSFTCIKVVWLIMCSTIWVIIYICINIFFCVHKLIFIFCQYHENKSLRCSSNSHGFEFLIRFWILNFNVVRICICRPWFLLIHTCGYGCPNAQL